MVDELVKRRGAAGDALGFSEASRTEEEDEARDFNNPRATLTRSGRK